jgi:hypothetical protein
MDVGSRRISVLQVVREPDVACETGSAAPLSRHVGASSRLQPAQWSIVPVSAPPRGLTQQPRSTAPPRGPARGPAPRPRPAAPTQRHLRSLAYAAGPPCYRIRGRSTVRVRASDRADPGVRGSGSGLARVRFPDWRGSAGSAQRINGVSRLLPYSDLLALTSSSRRGEDVSD